MVLMKTGIIHRDYPQSIKRFLNSIGIIIDEDRKAAIDDYSELKNNCKKLAVLSKSFVTAMDKSYMKFTQFHIANEGEDFLS